MTPDAQATLSIMSFNMCALALTCALLPSRYCALMVTVHHYALVDERLPQCHCAAAIHKPSIMCHHQASSNIADGQHILPMLQKGLCGYVYPGQHCSPGSHVLHCWPCPAVAQHGDSRAHWIRVSICGLHAADPLCVRICTPSCALTQGTVSHLGRSF